MKSFFSTVMAMLLWGAFHTSAMASGCTPGTFPGAFNGEVTVCQGWDSDQQQAFWFTGQGSMIIPYGWFLKLEKANSADAFSSPGNMDEYRYLPQRKTDMNPDGLPIGFTKDDAMGNEEYREMSRKWLGLTCAACHTGQIEYGNYKVLIDGAPTMADFQTFFEDMAAAMQATRDNDATFNRFADKVIRYNKEENTGGATDKATLREHLDKMTVIRETWNKRNSGSSRYGNARLDALGAILNQIRLTAGMGVKYGKADAPVSYPFIWDTPQHDKVQWNGSVRNAGPGALSRNIGEVLGVFGALDLNTDNDSIEVRQSSVNVTHLGQLEKLLWGLQSPKWEDTELPKIDASLAENGEGIYKEKCSSCHAFPTNPSNRQFEIKAEMVPLKVVKTDDKMAMNFLSRIADLGMLQSSIRGVIINALSEDPLATVKAMKAGQPSAVVKIIEKAAEGLKGIKKANLEDKITMEMIGKFFKTIDDELKKLKKLESEKEEVCSPPCYKARPLNGIWATAPYLHNGSVRTIRQLLMPNKRDKQFNVGSREYDSENMGFKDAGNFVLNTELPGNSNTGHKYYGDYFEKNEEEFKALMAYLKSL